MPINDKNLNVSTEPRVKKKKYEHIVKQYRTELEDVYHCCQQMKSQILYMYKPKRLSHFSTNLVSINPIKKKRNSAIPTAKDDLKSFTKSLTVLFSRSSVAKRKTSEVKTWKDDLEKIDIVCKPNIKNKTDFKLKMHNAKIPPLGLSKKRKVVDLNVIQGVKKVPVMKIKCPPIQESNVSEKPKVKVEKAEINALLNTIDAEVEKVTKLHCRKYPRELVGDKIPLKNKSRRSLPTKRSKTQMDKKRKTSKSLTKFKRSTMSDPTNSPSTIDSLHDLSKTVHPATVTFCPKLYQQMQSLNTASLRNLVMDNIPSVNELICYQTCTHPPAQPNQIAIVNSEQVLKNAISSLMGMINPENICKVLSIHLIEKSKTSITENRKNIQKIYKTNKSDLKQLNPDSVLPSEIKLKCNYVSQQSIYDCEKLPDAKNIHQTNKNELNSDSIVTAVKKINAPEVTRNCVSQKSIYYDCEQLPVAKSIRETKKGDLKETNPGSILTAAKKLNESEVTSNYVTQQSIYCDSEKLPVTKNIHVTNNDVQTFSSQVNELNHGSILAAVNDTKLNTGSCVIQQSTKEIDIVQAIENELIDIINIPTEPIVQCNETPNIVKRVLQNNICKQFVSKSATEGSETNEIFSDAFEDTDSSFRVEEMSWSESNSTRRANDIRNVVLSEVRVNPDEYETDVVELENLLTEIKKASELMESCKIGTLPGQTRVFQDAIARLRVATQVFEIKYKLKSFLFDRIKQELQLQLRSQIFDVILHSDSGDFARPDLPSASLLEAEGGMLSEVIMKYDISEMTIDIRRIGPNSVLVKWSSMDNQAIVGFEIWVNGRVKTKIYSPKRTAATLDGLELKSKLFIEIYPINCNGRYKYAATTTYKML